MVLNRKRVYSDDGDGIMKIKHMKSTHNWQRKGETIMHDGRPGYFLECDGCGHQVSIHEDTSDFGIEIAIILHFCSLTIDEISDEVYKAGTVPTPNNKFGFKEKGYHGVLAEDCDKAREFNIVSVMEM